ncbi:MAG: hypothetical protein HY519_01880 [Candidatus Aenigmarchaeota archaeon]|nr:hypothetical protein [Candidatus Aenigmarchaeota archaeon]
MDTKRRKSLHSGRHGDGVSRRRFLQLGIGATLAAGMSTFYDFPKREDFEYDLMLAEEGARSVASRMLETYWLTAFFNSANNYYADNVALGSNIEPSTSLKLFESLFAERPAIDVKLIYVGQRFERQFADAVPGVTRHVQDMIGKMTGYPVKVSYRTERPDGMAAQLLANGRLGDLAAAELVADNFAAEIGQPYAAIFLLEADLYGPAASHYASFEIDIGGVRPGPGSKLLNSNVALVSAAYMNDGQLHATDQHSIASSTTHELGHLLGMPHAALPNDIMYPERSVRDSATQSREVFQRIATGGIEQRSVAEKYLEIGLGKEAIAQVHGIFDYHIKPGLRYPESEARGQVRRNIRAALQHMAEGVKTLDILGRYHTFLDAPIYVTLARKPIDVCCRSRKRLQCRRAIRPAPGVTARSR